MCTVFSARAPRLYGAVAPLLGLAALSRLADHACADAAAAGWLMRGRKLTIVSMFFAVGLGNAKAGAATRAALLK